MEKIQTNQIMHSVWPRIILLLVLGYEGAGAIVGGSLLMARPDGKYMDMPVELLHGAFPNFIIPGIILLGLGILNALAFFSVLKKRSHDWILACLGLGGFIIWFIVEIIILKELHWLHLMWGLPVLLGSIAAMPLIVERNHTAAMQKGLLICGIISSVWYIVINIIVPMYDESYSMVSYTVSELSALGSPTRILWVLLVLAYPLLFAAFGWGILNLTEGHHKLRSVGWLIIVYCIFNLYWPPMHLRGHERALTDNLHIIWAIITNIFMWSIMVIAALALDNRFRHFTFISILLHLVFGVLTLLESPNIALNGPTPLIGIWERINILIFMLWVVVFALILIGQNFLKNWIKAHPMVIYYLLTLLISWGGLMIIAGGPSGISPSHPIKSFLPVYFSTVAGPLISGLLLIGLYDGIKGYREFISQLCKWRVRVKWYLLAIIIAPITAFSALFILSIFSPSFQPAIFGSGENPVASSFGLAGAGILELFPFVLMLGLFNGFVEEVGWTGFVTPRINMANKWLEHGLFLGFMWGLWHFLSNYSGSALEAGKMPLPLYLMVTLFSFLPPFRILMLWVYKHTESLLIAILMHASLNVFWILAMPTILTGEQRVIWYLAWAALLWIAVMLARKMKNNRQVNHTLQLSN